MSVKSCLKRCGPALLLSLALLSLPGLAQAIQVEVSWTYEAAPEGPQGRLPSSPLKTPRVRPNPMIK